MNNPLDFGGDPDHDTDSGIFVMIPISLSIKTTWYVADDALMSRDPAFF